MKEDGNGSTNTAKTRWKYTNDFLAWVILTSLPTILVLYGLGEIDTIPKDFQYLYGVVCLLAAIWTFGPSSVEALKELRKEK